MLVYSTRYDCDCEGCAAASDRASLWGSLCRRGVVCAMVGVGDCSSLWGSLCGGGVVCRGAMVGVGDCSLLCAT